MFLRNVLSQFSLAFNTSEKNICKNQKKFVNGIKTVKYLYFQTLFQKNCCPDRGIHGCVNHLLKTKK